MIHFELKNVDKIVPVGQEPNLYLSWFWLTEGDLWLTLGNQTIFEYTSEAVQHFGDKTTPYNDYYIVRFLEDFTKCFTKIGVSIPLQFYALTENMKLFQNNAQKWLEINENDEEEFSEFYFDEYYSLISWYSERLFDSAHLVGGPYLSFFRFNDKIRIVWETEHQLENGINLWTAKDGCLEMNYLNFVQEVKNFGHSFFDAMEKQVNATLAKDWGNIKLDKKRLVEEHNERKREFDQNLFFLEHDSIDKTDWMRIEQLYQRMKSEI